ncbi:hypothetical protein [Burkholderia gladioli]|uniref:hypothetical protein n=1 Tax=Burkholderia gladioli TaxID=28095 RepID=UPI001641FF8D|nr:hypothetical protein [Burkholderia gladioli]
MAKPSFTAPACATPQPCSHAGHTDDIGELRIELDPRFGLATYIGTRMQLAAEGLIPAGFEWPDGFRRYDWEADGLDFSLVRTAPAGIKGRPRSFFDCDNWRLVMMRSGDRYDFLHRREVESLERELAAIKHRETPIGKRENSALWGAIYRARDDKAYQAFKALLPCLTPPPGKRRGRPPRKEVSHD